MAAKLLFVSFCVGSCLSGGMKAHNGIGCSSPLVGRLKQNEIALNNHQKRALHRQGSFSLEASLSPYYRRLPAILAPTAEFAGSPRRR